MDQAFGDSEAISDMMDPVVIEPPPLEAVDDIMELGDYVVIDTTAYGRIIGTVVYRSLERISIQPQGVSNFVQHLTVHYDEEQGESFEEADGVQAAYVIEKRQDPTFVVQHNLRVGQIIDTYDADQQLALSYEIIAVDPESDAITLRDPNDPEQPLNIVFGGVGIELDAPFATLRVRPVMEAEKAPHKEDDDEVEPVEVEVEEEEEEEQIEVVGVVEMASSKVFREAAAYEQRIPDDLQKVDALNDFLAGLNPSVQKDPRAVRSIRILIETLFYLKQETVQYHRDGSIEGPKSITVESLRELIERTPMPLGRPVLAVQKRIYQPDEEPQDGIYTSDIVQEIKAQTYQLTKTVSASKGSAPREWKDQQEMVQLFGSPWKSTGGKEIPASEPISSRQWTTLADTEFFRVSRVGDEIRDVVGLQPSHESNMPPTLDTTSIGVERALATTYRKAPRKGVQALHAADTAPLSTYLLFPLSVIQYGLGAIRSRSLAEVSARSKMPRMLMIDLLKRVGEPDEFASPTELLMLEDDDYRVVDYVEGMSMPHVLGLGDTMDLLSHYGIDRYELTEDLHATLQDKIDAAQAQLISALATLRSLLAGIKEPQAEEGERFPAFVATLRKQPLLLSAIEEFERTHPNLMHTATARTGLLAHLLNHFNNYTQVAIGENPLLVAYAFQQAGLDEYLRHIRIAQRIRQMIPAERPKKNLCPHVAALVTIRRIADDGERFLQLTSFFKRFQGPREQNWINCTTCKEHLLCMHERLQIQAFLNTKEKATIEKQILLGFSGGVFQGKYICRNCGQPIRDLDFDRNIEFDDDGRPMAAAVSLSIEEEMESQVEKIITKPNENKTAETDSALTDEERKIYYVVRELAERIGITLEIDGYRRIMEDVQQFMNTLPTREEYYITAKKAAYEVFLARYAVTATATYLLIEVQSCIPPYVVRYTLMGCPDPGFDGWPLSTDRALLQGVNYISCAVSMTTRKDAPWSDTGFVQIPDDNKRLKVIISYCMNIIDHAISRADIQSKLALKRRYVQDVLGRTLEGESVLMSKERVMPTFLPELMVVSASEQAANAIIPEVMESQGSQAKQMGQTALAKLWIRQSHMVARQTARLVKGSPFAETTCCTVKLTEPTALGSAARVLKGDEMDAKPSEFPELASRALRPIKQGSFLLTNFYPRDANLGVVEPNPDLYYRIFLKYCFTGPRKGRLHEPGLTHRCLWCGFQFPSHPAVMDADKEGKPALTGVDTSTAEFTQLLDRIHTVNRIEPLIVKKHTTMDMRLAELGQVHPTPFAEWQDILRTTIEQCKRLPPTAQKDEVAQAMGQLSMLAREFEDKVHQGRRFLPAMRTLMSTLIELPWSNFFAVVQSYFIVPLQRILTQFQSLSVAFEYMLELSEEHVVKDIEPFLARETDYLSQFSGFAVEPSFEYAREKLQVFMKQWQALLPFAQRIRPSAVPGKERVLGYLKKALWYGILDGLFDSKPVKGAPVKLPMASVSDPSAAKILEIMTKLMKKFNDEKLSFNDKEIKEMMAVREEMERTDIIKRIHKMTDEEKAVEKLNKNYGLGDYAVGGSKLIWAYDKDYHDKESQKRDEAGIFDPTDIRSSYDEWAVGMMGERDDGYDVGERNDDD